MKLSVQTIQDMKALQEAGVRLSFLAKVVQHGEGVSLSATYYHCSPNRDSYEYRIRKDQSRQKKMVKEAILQQIEEGRTTGDISKEWGVPLYVINKIYAS